MLARPRAAALDLGMSQMPPDQVRGVPRCVLLAGLFVLLAGAWEETGRADIAVPQRILEPVSVEEAWNVIRLATANVEQLLREKRPLEITEQISLCSPSLRLLARLPPSADLQAKLDAEIARAFLSVNAIASAAMADNLGGAETAFRELRKVIDAIAKGYDEQIVKGEVYHCSKHPDGVATSPGAGCNQCAQKLVPRRIAYSTIYVRPDKPVMKVVARSKAPLVAGTAAEVTIQVQRSDGKPVPETGFLPQHGQAVHVLITGPHNVDFHRPIPVSTGHDGEYTCSFTPAFGGSYRVRAAVVPVETGLQEYPTTELACDGPPPSKSEVADIKSVKVDGLRLTIAWGGAGAASPQAGRIHPLRLEVTDADGQPVRRLEPLMNGFAFVAAFHADNETVLQMHPVGPEILRDDLRGGPILGFKFFPPKPGSYRLHAEVKVDGKRVIAPFAVQVAEAAER